MSPGKKLSNQGMKKLIVAWKREWRARDSRELDAWDLGTIPMQNGGKIGAQRFRELKQRNGFQRGTVNY